MTISEAAAMRELVARVDSLERQVKDQQRRLDDLSNAERARTERESQRRRGPNPKADPYDNHVV